MNDAWPRSKRAIDARERAGSPAAIRCSSSRSSPFLPIIAADYVVMIPLLMLYMVGFGQAMGILRDPPLCDDCGAIVKALPKPVRT